MQRVSLCLLCFLMQRMTLWLWSRPVDLLLARLPTFKSTLFVLFRMSTLTLMEFNELTLLIQTS
jgi:hypothetical protein